MREYTIQLNQSGEGAIEVLGNFIRLNETSAPSERYKVSATSDNGQEIVAVNMLNGGQIKNLPKTYSRIFVSNPNNGNGYVKVIAGVGEYEEGLISIKDSANILGEPVTFTAAQVDEEFIIPANDSRKFLHIQTDEFNANVVLINGGYEMAEANDWERPIKSEVRVTIKNVGDSVTYLEEL